MMLVGGIGGMAGGGQMIGAGVHFDTLGGGAGVGVGMSHLIVFCVGICCVTGLQSIGVCVVKVLLCEQSACGVRAALPTLSLKHVSAERTVVTMRKERMNFMIKSPCSCFAAAAFGICVSPCMI